MQNWKKAVVGGLAALAVGGFSAAAEAGFHGGHGGGGFHGGGFHGFHGAAGGMAVAVTGAAVASQAATGVAEDGMVVDGATGVIGAAATMAGVRASTTAAPTMTITRTTTDTSAATIGIVAIIPIATTDKQFDTGPSRGRLRFWGYGISGATAPSVCCGAISGRSGLENEIPRWIGVDAMTIGMLKITATRIVQASAA